MAFAQRRRGRAARVALLTVTVEEFEAVSDVFGLHHNIPGTPYFVASAEEPRTFDLVHRRMPGQTNIESIQTAGDLIEEFHPEFLLLIGTAGGHSGRDGLRLGDVVVANYVDYSGYWKYKDGATLQRKLPHDHPSAHLLQNYVEPLRAKPLRWAQGIRVARPGDGQPLALVGGIVSGNILLGDPDNQEQRRILAHFDKAYAFEMEAYGVATAVYKARTSVHYNPQYLVIRGISDLVDRDPEGNQEVRQMWTPYAVASAATFASVLVDDLFSVTGVRTRPTDVEP